MVKPDILRTNILNSFNSCVFLFFLSLADAIARIKVGNGR